MHASPPVSCQHPNAGLLDHLQPNDKDRLKLSLVIYMVIARRITSLMRLGRTVSELDAGLVFEDEKWRAAFILNKKPMPRKMPALNEAIYLIAQRGAFREERAMVIPVRRRYG